MIPFATPQYRVTGRVLRYGPDGVYGESVTTLPLDAFNPTDAVETAERPFLAERRTDCVGFRAERVA